MSKFVIEGGRPLSGTIEVAANKNAVLPMMAACLMTDQDCYLENVPAIADVASTVASRTSTSAPATSPVVPLIRPIAEARSRRKMPKEAATDHIPSFPAARATAAQAHTTIAAAGPRGAWVEIANPTPADRT